MYNCTFKNANKVSMFITIIIIIIIIIIIYYHYCYLETSKI